MHDKVAKNQSWDSVLFVTGGVGIRYLKTSHSVSVIRYFPKTGRSVSVFRYFRNKTSVCKTVLKHI